MMAKELDIRRLRSEGRAQCLDCDVLRPGATRERVALHVKQTGHIARFVVEEATIYQRKAS